MATAGIDGERSTEIKKSKPSIQIQSPCFSFLRLDLNPSFNETHPRTFNKSNTIPSCLAWLHHYYTELQRFLSFTKPPLQRLQHNNHRLEPRSWPPRWSRTIQNISPWPLSRVNVDYASPNWIYTTTFLPVWKKWGNGFDSSSTILMNLIAKVSKKEHKVLTNSN